MSKKPDEKSKTKNSLDPRTDLDPKNPRVLSREVFYQGSTVVHQGDIGYRAYYIERGRVEVLVQDKGHEVRIAVMGKGDIFGEMSLITKEPRSATVRTLEECVFTVISLDEIEGKIKGIKDPAISALIQVLADRLRVTTKTQISAHTSTYVGRITSLVDSLQAGISETKREAFRTDVTPILEQLQDIVDRYRT